MTQYGILDDEGQVIRWVDVEPVGDYVTRVIPVPKRNKSPGIDWDDYEEAPF